MRAQTITAPALLSALSGLFDKTCTIKEKGTETADAVGQLIPAWPTLTGHSAIACRFAPAATSRRSREPNEQMTVSTATDVVMLQGYYPLITTAMRAVVGAVTYQVVKVTHDSEELCTELDVEVVTT